VYQHFYESYMGQGKNIYAYPVSSLAKPASRSSIVVCRLYGKVKLLSVNTSPLERSRPRGGRYAWAMTDR